MYPLEREWPVYLLSHGTFFAHRQGMRGLTEQSIQYTNRPTHRAINGLLFIATSKSDDGGIDGWIGRRVKEVKDYRVSEIFSHNILNSSFFILFSYQIFLLS